MGHDPICDCECHRPDKTPGMQPHTEVEVDEIPNCDFCTSPAVYDGRTSLGAWGFMCEKHFKDYGVGLGLGLGQKLKNKNGTQNKK